jgi:hypothetical protein
MNRSRRSEAEVVRYLEDLDRAIVRQNGRDEPVVMGEGDLRLVASASVINDRRVEKEAHLAHLARARRERGETLWSVVRRIELGHWAVDAA